MRNLLTTVAVLGALFGLSACTGATAPDPSGTPSTPSSTSSANGGSAEPVPSGESPTLLPPVEQPVSQGGPWDTVGVTVTSAAEIDAVAAVPDSFRAFLHSRVGVEDEAGCTVTSITIKASHADGYVFGAEDSDCGDSQVVWGITENQWHYVVVFLEPMPCSDLTQNSVPTGTPGLRCTDNGEARDY